MAVAAHRTDAPVFADVAARLKAAHAEGLEATNAVILEHLRSPIDLIPEVARHLIMAGGKRLRPLLTLASAQVCGAQNDRPQLLAGAVELIHAATLLHDDVVDDSALRRGLKTANVVFGNKESVLVGDFLFARSFELMVKTGSLRVLDVLSKASSTIAAGEVLQLTTEADTATSYATYVEVIRAKTAALFAAAAEAGAIVADADADKVEGLRQYGENFGIAYQIIDDTLDYVSVAGDMGKSAGDDFREGKMTLPVILAMAHARSDDETAFWRRVLGERQQQAGDFEQAQSLIARDGVIDHCLTEAQAYTDAAVEGLAPLPESPSRGILEDLAISSVARRT